MARDVSELMDSFSPEQKLRIERRVAATLEKMILHDLRKLRRTTQLSLAGATGIAQSNSFGIESKTTLKLGTLDAYVRGLGGQLEIRAVFPEQVIAIELLHEPQSA